MEDEGGRDSVMKAERRLHDDVNDDDNPEQRQLYIHTHIQTCSPVHVQDSAASCADVADDHGRRSDALSMLRHQRHVDLELLKVLQNKTI